MNRSGQLSFAPFAATPLSRHVLHIADWTIAMGATSGN